MLQEGSSHVGMTERQKPAQWPVRWYYLIVEKLASIGNTWRL